MLQQRVGFIGAGQMATALGMGFVKAGLVPPANLCASDPAEAALARFAQATGAATFADNSAVLQRSEVVFLAVKPQQMAAVAAEVAPGLRPEQLVVSIAAGVRLASLQSTLGAKAKLVRVMPNTPCLVGKGACGFCLGDHANADDGQLVGRLLGAVGVAYQVDEKLLDAVTGLSGSGPAFVYMVIEALSDGGVRMGLPRNVATALAAQTVLGAAQVVLETGEHTGVLRDRVTSPGGTTIAGIQALEDYGLRAALMAAVEAATERSIELGS
ncbi:MAG: pyrroline-5-carboxylate reductase [Thermoguttaceae bacterium]|jgi:pyrroline-5-carboxylate reductase|nr:pyrroline-5-carboxylate reductase [Thermoguttaceae bacterium]